MVSVISATMTAIEKMVSSAFSAAIAAGEFPDAPVLPFAVEIPADTTKGDFASNAAMVNARAMRMSPTKIASVLASHFDPDGLHIDRWEVAGPGFINFFMSQEWFSEVLSDITAKGENYGRSNYGAGKKVMVEFVSANPTGPMHMGNARGGAIGDVLAEVFAWSGHDTTREFYINDAGNQIEKFGISLEARYMQRFLGEDKVEFPEDGYHGEDIKELAAEYAENAGDSLLSLSSEERRKALVSYALPKNIDKLQSDLAKYRINFDVWFRESTLHPDAINKIIGILREKNLVYEKDGAIWYKATDFGGEKDEVLVRTNGIPTYFAADIAYHYNKFSLRGFDKVINIWGADHHGHVARLKGAMDAVGLDGGKLDIVLMQLVRLMKDGEPYRMSKRSGKAVTLSDLLEEVPIDAARFFFNMKEPGSSFDFDLDLAVEESSNNPVYYVQYAHARICSIEKIMKAQGYEPRPALPEELLLLSSPDEKELIRKLGQLPDEVLAAAKYYDPARITRYASEVATLYHRFYHNCRIKGEEPSLVCARMALSAATAAVLRNALSILKISAPDIM